MIFDDKKYIDSIFKIKSQAEFNKLALYAFEYQYSNNEVYRNYCNLLEINPNTISKITDIPYLPIDFFKSRKVLCNPELGYETIFTSSGTSQSIESKHYVRSCDLYEQAFLESFRLFYGSPCDYVFLGLLPSYIERGGSSLVYMVDKMIRLSAHSESGFFLHNHEELYKVIESLESKKQKYILIGVSYALLDFVEKYELCLNNGIVMETGGMKGRRKELIRTELHSILSASFATPNIHSEYGMTELLSQSYSLGNGEFQTPAWKKILIRDTNDPFAVEEFGNGAINIIDLANIYSCCFIASSDLGSVNTRYEFTINGRFDNAEIRGCNLMVSDL